MPRNRFAPCNSFCATVEILRPRYHEKFPRNAVELIPAVGVQSLAFVFWDLDTFIGAVRERFSSQVASRRCSTIAAKGHTSRRLRMWRAELRPRVTRRPPLLRFKHINTPQSLRSRLTQLFCCCRASAGLLNPRPWCRPPPSSPRDLLTGPAGASPFSPTPTFYITKIYKIGIYFPIFSLARSIPGAPDLRAVYCKQSVLTGNHKHDKRLRRSPYRHR